MSEKGDFAGLRIVVAIAVAVVDAAGEADSVASAKCARIFNGRAAQVYAGESLVVHDRQRGADWRQYSAE